MTDPRLTRRSFLATAALLAGCGPRDSTLEALATPKATLMLIGGSCQPHTLATLQASGQTMPEDQLDPHGLHRKMLELTGKSAPIVEVITLASPRFAEETASEYDIIFSRLGARTGTISTRDDKKIATDPSLRQRLERADLVFITGGDQEDLTRLLSGSPLLKILQKRYATDPDFVLAGTSAGSMVMAQEMIGAPPQPRDCPRMAPGFGVVGAVIDTHLSAPGRAPRDRRMLHALCASSAPLGIGLENATGIIIKNGELSVTGPGQVLMACKSPAPLPQQRRCQLSDLHDCSDFTSHGLELYRLKSGDTVSLEMPLFPGNATLAARSR